jgi:hypothetical protein
MINLIGINHVLILMHFFLNIFRQEVKMLIFLIIIDKMYEQVNINNIMI